METIVVATINGVFGIIVLVVGYKLNNKIKQVKDQVVNGHSTNMREENDERHSENGEKLDRILEELKHLKESVGRLWIRSDKHTDKIHELELTQPRKGKQK